ncbi:MAG: hypothetical protein ACPKQO_10450 [Nitrososphaeraceae archaeon]
MQVKSEKQDTVIVELFHPIYDSNKTLKYDVTPINSTSIELPSDFERSTFNRFTIGINSIYNKTTPV